MLATPECRHGPAHAILLIGSLLQPLRCESPRGASAMARARRNQIAQIPRWRGFIAATYSPGHAPT